MSTEKKAQNDTTYSFSISYEGKNFTVDTIVNKLESWQRNFGGEKVGFIVKEEVFGVLGIFSIKSQKLEISITGPRHARILCNLLGIAFKDEKRKYQKDLFDLSIL